jgi:hypothetical protein
MGSFILQSRPGESQPSDGGPQSSFSNDNESKRAVVHFALARDEGFVPLRI